ncbi:MAG TPA: S8 family serine peptidase [Telluria sp.]|jgi:subtilisin family serine protease
MKTKHIILRSETMATRDVWRGASTLQPNAVGTLTQGLSAESLDIDRRTIPLLTRDAGVLAIAPAMPMRLVSPFDATDPGVTAQTVTWGVHAVGADTSPFTGEGIVVAVIDTGIDSGHPAFAGVELVQKDFTGDGNGDQHGHGTHCAGTIFGRAVNGTRIGVAPGVRRALIGKVLDSSGGGSSDHIVEAILWAVEEGAHIISMSIGMDFGGYVAQLIAGGMPAELATSRALEGYRTNTRLFDSLSEHVRARGLQTHPTLIVAAAGNESQRDVNPEFEVAVSPPAIAEGIVSVAALGDSPAGYATAPFSNTGANVSGPGVGIVSAKLGGGLQTMSGTSMATPHVAGVAALWAQQLVERNSLNVFNLIGRLAGSATSEHLTAGFDPFDVGAGLVQCPQSV